jgi:hypothetical protein
MIMKISFFNSCYDKIYNVNVQNLSVGLNQKLEHFHLYPLNIYEGSYFLCWLIRSLLKLFFKGDMKKNFNDKNDFSTQSRYHENFNNILLVIISLWKIK